jgi:hypothetical protein
MLTGGERALSNGTVSVGDRGRGWNDTLYEGVLQFESKEDRRRL